MKSRLRALIDVVLDVHSTAGLVCRKMTMLTLTSNKKVQCFLKDTDYQDFTELNTVING